MIPVKNWVERTFTFGIPLWMAPDLMERLCGVTPRIRELTHGTSSKLLTTRVDSKWSVQEEIGHLLVLEELWQGRLDDFEAGLPKMRAADMKNVKTFESNFNTWELDRLLSAFLRERAQFLARLEKMSESELRRVSIHPRLNQPINLVDSMFFIAEHDDHHLAMMRQKLRQLRSV